MGVGAGLYMCDVVKKFTFAISSPDEFLFYSSCWWLIKTSWILHCVSKKASHLWLAVTLTHVNGFWYFFGTNALAVLVHWQNSTSRCLISVFLTNDSYSSCYMTDSLNLVINVFSLGLLRAWFRRNEVKSTAAVGLCCTHKAPVHCLLCFLFCKVMLKH